MIGYFGNKKDNKFKRKITNTVITLIISIVIVLVVYTIIDTGVDREYMTTQNSAQLDGSYKNKFFKLISDIEEGVMTGIPSYDDAGVGYGDTVVITKGIGDFVGIQNSMNISNKTYTYYNNTSWNATSDQFVFAYSKKIHESSTIYENTGIVKLFDRYVWTAVGTYWADVFGLSANTGNTYRINLDTGISYDIISFDVKSPAHTVNTPGKGLSLGQVNKDKTNICLTEFNILDYTKNYPIRIESKGSKPDMDYGSLLTMKKDVSHVKLALTMGSFDYVPEFKGNIISVQVIKDPAVEEIFKEATEEVKIYR